MLDHLATAASTEGGWNFVSFDVPLWAWAASIGAIVDNVFVWSAPFDGGKL